MLKYKKDELGQDILLDSNDEQVMMEWEKPYMEACIDFLEPKGDVLEIGFGMGYSATQIQKYNPKSYTIIECDPVVIKKCKEWAKQYNNVTIIEAKWQEVITTDRLIKYDEVFFDDFPNDVKYKTAEHFYNVSNRFYLFIQFMQMYHLKSKAKISGYLCKKESMFNDPQWKHKFIDNPSWDYKEKIMEVKISKIQRYHESKDKAIIPLLVLS